MSRPDSLLQIGPIIAPLDRYGVGFFLSAFGDRRWKQTSADPIRIRRLVPDVGDLSAKAYLDLDAMGIEPAVKLSEGKTPFDQSKQPRAEAF